LRAELAAGESALMATERFTKLTADEGDEPVNQDDGKLVHNLRMCKDTQASDGSVGGACSFVLGRSLGCERAIGVLPEMLCSCKSLCNMRNMNRQGIGLAYLDRPAYITSMDRYSFLCSANPASHGCVLDRHIRRRLRPS
jgi:hypothetical protein